MLTLRLNGIVLWLLRIVVFVGLFFLYQVLVTEISYNTYYSWMAILLLLVLVVFLSKIRLQEKGAFFADIARERDARMRIVSLMLIRVIERKRKPTRKYPLLFGKSQRLFKGKGAGNGIADLLAKSFFRNGTQWRQTIQFVVVISGAMFILPGAIKITIWILAACPIGILEKIIL